MARGGTPWGDGRRAWERLKGWYQDRPPDAGQPGDGGDALSALSDIGLVRRLLDQAELAAVKTARSHRRSWAEIATRLGVTRQTAWERWRDLDDAAEPPAAVALEPDRLPTVQEEVVARAAREVLRRGAPVIVPDLIGLAWDDAWRILHTAGLVAIGPHPDGGVLPAPRQLDGVVVGQRPNAGATVPRGTYITVWIERGPGSAGVREPRRPTPAPRSATGMRDELSGEAIG